MTRQCAIIAGWLLLVASFGVAGEVQTWTQQTTSDFDQGRLEGVVVGSDGSVELSRRVARWADLEVAHIWSTALEDDGSLLAATGSPGRVVRLRPNGEVVVLHEARDQQIFAITRAADGTLYFGSSPSGEVFRLNREGRAEVLLETEETYIWGLAVDSSGRLLVATGPQGRLYRVSADGQAEILFQAKQKHLLSMVAGADNSVYVGTSTEGLVYRVDGAGKSFVLHDAAQSDVHALYLDEQGSLYAGTGTPDRPNLSAAPSSIQPLFAPAIARALWASAILAPPLVPVAEGPAPAPAPRPAPAPGPSSRPATFSSLAMTGENAVFRILASGQVDEVFREKCLVLSLGTLDKNLLIGTGQEGVLYSVDPESRVRRSLARLESGQIQSMARLPGGGIALGTGTPGQVWKIEPQYQERGSFESSTLDARDQARWGKGSVSADVPTGTKLRVEYRAGNVEKPDDSWSAWTTESSTLPLTRFLQYRALFESTEGAASARLARVSVYYTTVNKAPTVEQVEVPLLAQKPVADCSAKLEIKWKGSDPNGDTLAYDLDVRKEDWPEWVAVAREFNGQSFAWDPGSLPSGVYRFRVTASDSPSNRPAETKTASRTSEPFLLDREAPQVTVVGIKQVANRLEVTTQAHDGQTRLVAAAYSLNGIDWWPLFADDGIFDSTDEAVTFQTGELKPGAYLVLVRYRDSAGHYGVADRVSRVEPAAPPTP